MGGTRCSFRQCLVNSAKIPRMHFFRFPIKDAERFRKWRKYSKMEHMLEFSEVRKKNTSICGRHFRVECFMNYKLNSLTSSAVPTIMRLSNDQALDFELDLENGVLVTLEIPKLKHLIPPNDFECPLDLMNDKVLLDKLKELQTQQCIKNTADLTENDDYMDSDNCEVYEEIIVEPEKTVEILESVCLTTPKSKRPRIVYEVMMPASSGNSNKKCRILNTTNCAGKNGTESSSKIFIASQSFQLKNKDNHDEIDIEESETKNAWQFVDSENELTLTDEIFIDSDIKENEHTELEIDKQENSSHYELPSNDSDSSTIVKLKSYNQIECTETEVIDQEFLAIQTRLLELQQKCKDFDKIQEKLTLLETENKELKNISQVNAEIHKKFNSIQMENISIKKTLKDYEILKDKLQNYSEENKKLKEEAATNKILRSELLSCKQETKELKKLLEKLKSFKSKTEDDFTSNTSNEIQINELKTKLESMQHQLKDSKTEVEQLKIRFTDVETENNRLIRQIKENEDTFNNLQNNYDVQQDNYRTLISDYENLQQKLSVLEQKYKKSKDLQNQEATVSTSLEKTNISHQPIPVTTSLPTNSLTKAQLFNGIKRYLSVSMVSLLRMEMFGSSEREWKCDERQIAVDILRFGETLYKYFTDEWRIRLPALRDVRNWLTQSQQLLDDEEDL